MPGKRSCHARIAKVHSAFETHTGLSLREQRECVDDFEVDMRARLMDMTEEVIAYAEQIRTVVADPGTSGGRKLLTKG